MTITTSAWYGKLGLVLGAVLFTCITGCVTDPRADDGDNNGDGVGLVSVAAASINMQAVRVRWWQAKPLGSYIYYKLNWKSISNNGDPADSGSMDVYWFDGASQEFADGHTETVFTADVFHLQNKMYNFELVVYRNGQIEPVTVHRIFAAPAERYETDAALPGEPLRLYESGSSMGSGLIIDPAFGGPRRATLADAPPGGVQLAFMPADRWTAGKFVLAAAAASPEFATHAACDRTATSATTIELPLYPTGQSNVPQVDAALTSLSDWFSLHDRVNDITFSATDGPQIWQNNGTGGSGIGYGFFMEFGEISGVTGADNRRVCRIFVVPQADGSILRGTAPNRYVELHVSVGYRGVRWS